MECFFLVNRIMTEKLISKVLGQIWWVNNCWPPSILKIKFFTHLIFRISCTWFLIEYGNARLWTVWANSWTRILDCPWYGSPSEHMTLSSNMAAKPCPLPPTNSENLRPSLVHVCEQVPAHVSDFKTKSFKMYMLIKPHFLIYFIFIIN